ncbi:wd domain-containing protein [Diplodia corticola]|uniref:Wd domain-containing protein n=1 Tax=Diplodia corticola TaxID=236234 RepID=A0A1J9S477_9PEZI|nr:wd domain-containing protein [Diplodia corticola]OJD39747.1 wd domain-containing protein [Diplodia corticola]
MPATVTNTQVADGRVVKRKKLNASKAHPEGKPRPTKSRLFAPFRTVGLISPTDVPFTSIPLGKTTFQITTSVGRSLQTYDLRRGLNLVFITRPQTPELITATTAWKDKILAAWGGNEKQASRGVWLFKRGKKVAELETPNGWDENIKQLLVFGAWVIGCGTTRIDVWKSATLEHYTTLIAPRSGSAGSLLTGGVCNMPTYLNKLLAGRQDGSVEIWNINTGRLLYTILPAAAEYGHVTAMQPTPVLSLVAIAYSSGPVVIHDIRADKEVLTVNTGSSRKTPVTSISFRTDGQGAGEDGRKDGVMATASKHTGDVVFWDLNGGGRKMGVLRGAHAPPSIAAGGVAGGISKIEFLAGQAVVVTSGLDNSLKTWIFDQTPFSPVPRILHSRSGHAAPVSTLQFLPSDADGADAGGKWLVSASNDRTLWGWSLRRDGQSTELSQGNIRKKAKKMGILSEGLAALDSSLSIEDLRAPKITHMACSLNRDGGMGAVPGVNAIWNHPSKGKGATGGSEANGLTGWESMVTAHEDSKTARTWFWGKKKAGRWAFDTGDGTPVTSVAISPCGTFALVGSQAGGLDMFNLQSGIHRQRFPARLTPQQAKRLKLQQLEEEESMEVEAKPKKFARGQGKHTKAVTGIAVDSLNRTVVSCGDDGKVKFWDFSNGQLLHEIDWYPMVTINSLRYHSSSDLIAFACSDSSIRVVDIETKKLVRELFGCQGQINDFTFSNDGRWIIAASADSIIRVWDLPTGHMIDAMKLRSKCTSLGMSATGEYLAVAQEDNVGVNIWTNKTLFTHVPTRHISDDEIAEVDAPTASGEGGENIVSAAYAEEEEEEEEEEDAGIPSMDQLSESITTLSLVPKSRWQNLLHLDLIRERNKPKEAPKAPEKAPFFLPGLNGAANPAANSAIAGVEQQESAAKAGPVSRISKSGAHQSEFSRHLANAFESEEYDGLVSYLSTLPPSAADLAIRSLETPPSHEFLTFIQALTARLRQKRDYELVQAWMAVFLRLHGEDITSDEGVVEALAEWREEAGKERQRLGSLGGYCVGVVGFLRSAR